MAQAVPLSRQLVEAAGDGCDLDTAEGRARLLAQARPLVAQLPAGVLRGQIVDALAQAGKVPPQDLRDQWSPTRAPAGSETRARPDGAPGRPPPPKRPVSSRRPVATMASRLDRAVWLLLHRADLWDQLDHDAQHLLSEQPSPYADFFNWLERLLHDQGALALPALIGEMTAPDAPESLQVLAGRVQQFHDVEVGTEALAELGALLDGLRLQAITDELNLLAETQGLSEAAGLRQRALYAQQAELKKRLSRPSVQQP